MEAVNQGEISSVGTRLRLARQAHGMSIEDVSQHIKITPKQIEIIENNDFDTLGLVFSRGFVRNYARLVELDADVLIAEMSNTLQSKTEPLSIHDEHIPLTKGLSKYWLVMTAIAIALVIGVPLLVYHWLAADDAPLKMVTGAQPTVTASVTPPTKVIASPSTQTQATATISTTRGVQAADKPPSLAPTDNTAITPATGRLQFQFGQDSWVEIRDGKQHAVLSHLYRAGETAEVSGTPPLSLVIGNAAHVTLKYNDQTVDLAPHTAVTVARITLQ